MPRNEFKAPKGKGPNGLPHDVRTKCEVFKMTALNENDQLFLAHLYRCIWLTGGTVAITTPEGTDEYHFGA